jgi:dihydroorotate dehydrogenase
MSYEKILRPLLFRLTDPEKIHHNVLEGLRFVSQKKPLYNFIYKICNVKSEILHTKLGRLTLDNPVGLAAGFEKYVRAPLAYPMLGFGFAEIGSITFSEQPGNQKPRLWRLPKDKGLIVFYGLANDGAIKSIKPLSELTTRPVPYGISIAPTTGLDIKVMADDYIKTFLQLHPFADYITFNVSCPNVAKCDAFEQITFIEELVSKAAEEARKNGIEKDLYIKIGPHHSFADLVRIVDICINNGFTGIVATNLIKIKTGINAKSSANELAHPGGISGQLLQGQSDATIQQLYKYSSGKLKIIGVGGVFNAEDAYHKIKLGASAIQLITGFVYGGPLSIKRINEDLAKLLQRDGFKNIADAVGTSA